MHALDHRFFYEMKMRSGTFSRCAKAFAYYATRPSHLLVCVWSEYVVHNLLAIFWPESGYYIVYTVHIGKVVFVVIVVIDILSLAKDGGQNSQS